MLKTCSDLNAAQIEIYVNEYGGLTERQRLFIILT